ncbi:putative amino acid transporter [Rosellinia necatrix]|uniref:Putative amino acid transporter n=1 Tax=Rosellinia necatrix TaxID=77044 RepID=A0A1W2TIU1_ROSNE|nr:putative amino acid transporter [Rosellinia necatrix]
MISTLILTLCALPFGFSQPVGEPYERRDGTCTTKSVRKSWTDLTVAEKQSYLDADLCLMSSPPKSGIQGATSRWDELQYSHAAQARYIHNVGAFLPFHRYYVTVHDRLIRTECNYTGPLPYWDEPSDVGNIAGSPLFTEEPGFGGDGTGSDDCIADGPFADTTLHFKEDLTTSDYCISRALNDRGFNSGTRANAEACLQKDNFEDAWECLEGNPHNAGHGGVAGTMVNVLLSPGDPVFYLHHGYLDRVWWEWQSRDLTTRLTEIGGNNTPNSNSTGGFPGSGVSMPGPNKAFEDYFNDGGSITTLNHTLWSAGIVGNATIADVMDGEGEFVCADYAL